MPIGNLRSGEGMLEIAPRHEGGRVIQLVASPPLQLLHPKNHGHAEWVYLTTLGGGLVDGDQLALHVQVGVGASALLATQASTKIYPAQQPSTGCSQEIHAKVGDNGLLVGIPDPVVCFAGARYTQRSHIVLGQGASLLWLESITAGRTARAERWQFGRYESTLSIEQDHKPIIIDSLLLDPAQGVLVDRLGRFDTFATLVCVGPAVARFRTTWLESANQRPITPRSEVHLVASPHGASSAVVRLATTSVGALLGMIRSLLADLPNLLGDDPMARK